MWCSAFAQTAARLLERIRVRVSEKANKQWVWLALDIQTREVVEVHVCGRSRDGARKRGSKASQSSYDDLRIRAAQSITSVYRQYAVCYSDF